MKTLRTFLAFGAFTLVATGAAYAGDADQGNDIIDGRYQAVLGDCQACHTKPGGEPFAGGAPLETPFGTLVPPNITPDAETGIGNWSQADFHKMMKTGIGHDGIRLYPAMPYPAYTKMSDDDIDHLWRYMTTIEPVHNDVEANQLPFPFNIRLAMLGWNMLNFKEGGFKPDPNQSAEWNRGAYIVQGAGHCATCHSPKSFLGADKDSEFLQGASLQGWYAPNITGNGYDGIGSWSDDDLVQYLKTGVNGHTMASGPMAEAVENSTSLMNDGDLKAIAVYLKSLGNKDAKKPEPIKADDSHMTAGLAIYQANCSACHGADGKGANQLFPSLAGNSIVQQKSAETLAHLVLAGSQAVHTKGAPTTPAMPSLAWRLKDDDVANVLTYIRNSWGNAAPAVDVSTVADVRQPD
ncbi:c-type cytochrome [Rhizobium halophytocola]|uniref:Mono/diheme cytochrome c family protein n=1 Tax=Rhizobium halophytocola TaxID=735519 RepID=A0ABS4DU43_9HYPH|nr:cytochrome c [Rhizobium halophytocola]MBP1849139.1 mono/diheme cytochrome c family protein [Rhizobium halophytocola]